MVQDQFHSTDSVGGAPPAIQEQFCPVIVKPEDEELKRQLYELAEMPANAQVGAFTRLLGVPQVCSLETLLTEQFTVNFVGCGFVDLAYMARLTRKDLDMLHILGMRIVFTTATCFY